MAQIVGNQIKLNNGQMITPQSGEWYDSQQYWGGTLSSPGQINPLSNQQGAGQQVSPEVSGQTSVAAGLAPTANQQYIQQQQATAPVTPATPVAGAATPAGFGTPQPTIDVQAIYNQAFNTPEITTAQTEIDTKTKTHDDALAIINDNPFYSEATRVGKINQLNQQYNTEMTRLQNQQAKLKADAEIKVNIAMKQYDINNQAYKDQLNLFNSLLSAGGLTNASGTELANYAVATGIPVSMLESIVSKQKQEEIKPQAITSTDNSGNVTVSIVDTMTGKVISKTSLGQIGAAKTSTATENKQSYYDYAKQDARSGVTLPQMLQIYGGYLTPNEIYATYNANSVKGQGGYGPATESAEQLKAWGINPNLSAADALSATLGAGSGGQ